MKVEKEEVIKIIKTFQLPIVTDKNHPAGWWATAMGNEIHYSISTQLKRIIAEVNKLKGE